MKFGFLVCCVLTLVNSSSEEYVDDVGALVKNTDGANYVLVAPGTLLAGSSNRLCFSRLGRATQAGARLQLDILSDGVAPRGHIARLRKSFAQGNGGCFDMVVPKMVHTKVTLHIRIRFDAMPSYEVVRYWRGVRVLPVAGVVTVQTDRPMYRTGDTVRFRILHLKPDLLPVHTPIRRVWVEAPGAAWGGRARAAQWERVRTQLGLAQFEYVLDQHAQKGEWSIHVATDDGGSEAAVETFKVADYTLPTFYLTVQHPAKLLRTAPRITWTICVRHMWGEGVRGALTARVHSDGGAAPIRLTARLYGQPCHNHTVDAKRLGFVAAGADEPSVIVADITFQEESTRMWKNISVISNFVEDSVNIEFINKNKMFVSPGLPYKTKMKVTDWNEEPIPTAAVKVCRSATNSTESTDPDENSIDGKQRIAAEPCDTLYTDNKGYVQASFNVPMDLAAKYYKIKATVRTTHAYLTLPVRGGDRVHAALGALGSGGLRNHVPLFISYPAHMDVMAPTIHFMLITRGGVIFRWGATTQCPQPPTASLSSRHIAHPSTRCQAGSASRTLLRLALPARVSHQMCPHSHMLVYFYHEGEVVVAAKHFKVSECFYNKVVTRWNPAVVAPGNSTRLTISSLGPALCATSVSDVALRHTLPSAAAAPTLQTQLLNKLRVFMETRKNITLRDLPQRSCFKENGITEEAAEDYEFLLSTFSTTGMRIISDLLPELDCSNDQPEPLEQPASSATYERAYFPESWLWNLQLLSGNGSLEIDVKAPDAVTQYETTVTCVSRSGVSVAPTTILKVFQPFFVELETPKKLKRGEQTQFFYKIYNYIDASLAVTVDLETEADSGISVRGTKGSAPASHTICVGVSDMYSLRLGVVGTKAGSWRLSVKVAVVPQMQHYCGGDAARIFPSDKITKQIIVEPEGEQVEIHRSAMLCTEGNGRYASELEWKWEGNDSTVPGTERWLLWLIGDLAGPVDLNADKLLSLPLGCGEQNMARLAHNLVALSHMELRGHVSQELKDKALANIMSGYARQMRYVHPKGGFSAFGAADESPSSWLTAFSLRYLHAARRRISLEGPAPALAAAEDWLVSLQMENGCFQNVGQIFHREFKGGLESEASNIALAAYILVSLIEAGTVLRPTVVQSASYCLQALYHSPEPLSHPYTLALVAYAQTRLERYEADIQERNDINLKREPVDRSHFAKANDKEPMRLEDQELANEKASAEETKINRDPKKDEDVGVAYAISSLRRIARRSGDLVWWEAESLSSSIESTAYAVLALLAAHKNRTGQLGAFGVEQDQIELEDAGGAVRWLSLHRNLAGGFLSTQDTLVGLEAIAAWSAATAHSPPQLDVTVSGPGLAQTLTIDPRTRHDLHTLTAQAYKGDKTVRVRAQGTGCVLVQATQQYNSEEPVARSVSPFSLQAAVKTDGTFDCQNNGSWCRCAAILEVCVSWIGREFPEMAILEIDLPTEYVTDKTLLYRLLSSDNVLLRRLEEWEMESRVVLYLAMKGSYRGGKPRECYNLYLIGPQSKTAPAKVLVYDYYHKEVNSSQRYVIPESCSGPLAHPEPSNLGSNNIYRLIDDRARHLNTEETTDTEQSSAEVYPYALPNSGSQESDETEGTSINPIIAAPSYANTETENLKTQVEEITGNKGDPVVYPLDTTHLEITSTEMVSDRPHIAYNTEKNSVIEINWKQSERPPIKVEPETPAEKNLELTTSKPFENFHVIDTDMDLDVPEGVEGPIPNIVAPPAYFFWDGESQSTPKSLLDKEEPPINPSNCPDRFANWTAVTHDLEAAEDRRYPTTRSDPPCLI